MVGQVPGWPGALYSYVGRQQDSHGQTILACEALIDASTFRLAGKALDGRPKRGPQKSVAMLGAGVMVCPGCGSTAVYRLRDQYRCHGTGSQRQGCGSPMISLDVADQLASEFMAGLDAPILRTRIEPGQDNQAAMDAVKLDIRGLDMDAPDYDERHAALRSELARLRNAPATPDRTITEPTGESYGQRWMALSGPERHAWLLSQESRCMELGRTLATHRATTPRRQPRAQARTR